MAELLRATDPEAWRTHPLGQRAVDFVSRLTLVGDYSGEPFVLRPYQDEFVRRLYGTIRPDGLRQYRTAFMLIPRGNAKTTLNAALALQGLLATGRTGQEIYSCAGDKKQARLIFKTASQMVRADDYLRSRCKILDSKNQITVESTDCTYEALSKEAGTKHGLNASLVIFDELHVQKTPDLFNTMVSCQGKRREPLFISITTAGSDQESLCYREFQYAKKVRDGVIDEPTYLPVLYYAEPEEDWNDEAVWYRCNPALGDFLSIDFMRAEWRKAKENPINEARFRQLYLNQWVLAGIRFLTADQWRACKTISPVDPNALAGARCFGGLDLSSTTDLTAFVLLFPLDDGRYFVLPHFWLPEDGIEAREARDHVNYRAWANAGLLTLTEGAAVDYDSVVKYILRADALYSIEAVLADFYNSNHSLSLLRNEGIIVRQASQAIKYISEPTKELQRLVLKRLLVHDGNPILAWNVDNCRAIFDESENIRLSKRRSAGRIDGVAGLVNAISGEMTMRRPAVTLADFG